MESQAGLWTGREVQLGELVDFWLALKLMCAVAQAAVERKEVGGGTNARVEPGDERVPACEVVIVQTVAHQPRSIPSSAKYFSFCPVSSQVSDQHPQLVDFFDLKTRKTPILIPVGIIFPP